MKLLVAVLAVLAVVAVTAGIASTAATFTDEYPVTGAIGAGQVFPGERPAVPFAVTDASSGSEVDASNPVAFAGDNLALTTSSSAAAFATDRYVEYALNSPLPNGIGIASSSFALTYASATPGATACFYFEVRSETAGGVIETHGGPGSAVGCVSGTTLTTTSTSLSSVGTTTVANDLRIRLYGADSASGGAVIDRATVAGNYGLASFTLYPVEVRAWRIQHRESPIGDRRQLMTPRSSRTYAHARARQPLVHRRALVVLILIGLAVTLPFVAAATDFGLGVSRPGRGDVPADASRQSRLLKRPLRRTIL